MELILWASMALEHIFPNCAVGPLVVIKHEDGSQLYSLYNKLIFASLFLPITTLSGFIRLWMADPSAKNSGTYTTVLFAKIVCFSSSICKSGLTVLLITINGLASLISFSISFKDVMLHNQIHASEIISKACRCAIIAQRWSVHAHKYYIRITAFAICISE